eukprot:gene1579-1725_t
MEEGKREFSFHSLERIPLNELTKTFGEAFADYAVHFNESELQAMWVRRGFQADLSFGAFHTDRLVSFTLNGVGLHEGQKTAYDTGTGTVPACRGQKLVSAVFTHSIPFLRQAGIKQYLLEVLQENIPAITIYKGIGFKVTRELAYFKQQVSDLRLTTGSTTGDVGREEDRKVDFTLPIDYALEDIHPAVLVEQLAGSTSLFWDVSPSWQNSFASVLRAQHSLVAKIVRESNSGTIAGYCIFEPSSGDITQIAVAKNHRRKGLARVLLHSVLHHHCTTPTIKLVNIEDTCESVFAFAHAIELPLKGKQFEMILEL